MLRLRFSRPVESVNNLCPVSLYTHASVEKGCTTLKIEQTEHKKHLFTGDQIKEKNLSQKHKPLDLFLGKHFFLNININHQFFQNVCFSGFDFLALFFCLAMNFPMHS